MTQASTRSSLPRRMMGAMVSWIDTRATDTTPDADDDRIDWIRVLPFIGMHLACLGVLWTGFSWFALWTALAMYAIRMFAITAGYHRYFSHRAFRAPRSVQFVLAVLGASAVQRGPLWWAAHHRNHHRHADQPADVHSPVQHGFWHSHMGWFLTRRGFATDWSKIPDLARYPELRLLDRFDILVPIAMAAGLFALGSVLHATNPALGVTGGQLLVWGFFISTVVLFHVTGSINSLGHRFGSRRYATRDESRNNLWLALLTFGEGWHNNHHFYPGAARQGFRWWEVDLTYYLLRGMAAMRLIDRLKTVPPGLRRSVPGRAR